MSTEQTFFRLQRVFNALNQHNLDSLDEVYAADVQFIDPFHQLNGLDAFKSYCGNLYTNVQKCNFEFAEHLTQDQTLFCTWQMHLSHPKLKRGQTIELNGCSHIRANGKIYFQRDYYDGGEMLYENIPVLGSIIKTLKGRMQ